MTTFVLIFLGVLLGFVFDFIMYYVTDHDFSYRVRCWLDNLKKSRSGVVYVVRKTNTDSFLKEDCSYSRLGEGLAPLLFYSRNSARQTMELLERNDYEWIVIETSKDILSDVVNWSRSEKPKDNFHKFKIDDREANDIKPITRRCANCDHSELGNGLWYCFKYHSFMSPNGWCESWGGEDK